MGTLRDQEQERKDAKRQQAAKKRETKRRVQGSVDVTALPWLAMVALIAEMAENGGAVRVGLTRDRGALALGMYMGDDYATEYIRPNEDIEAAIHSIADVWLTDGILGLERRMVKMTGPGKS